MRTMPRREDWCNSCEHFIQHYVWSNGEYIEADSGHCVWNRRIRRRRGTNPVCENWTPQSETYKHSRTPAYEQLPERRPEKEYCIRIQVFEEP